MVMPTTKFLILAIKKYFLTPKFLNPISLAISVHHQKHLQNYALLTKINFMKANYIQIAEYIAQHQVAIHFF